MWLRVSLGMLAMLSCLLGGAAQAALLNAPTGLPDIRSINITVNYNAGTTAFTAIGTAATMEYPAGNFENITGGGFDLTAHINATTGALAVGSQTLTITDSSSTLLTGILTNFGAQAASLSSSPDLFEFLFTVTGGTKANLYGGVGSLGDVLVASATGFTGFPSGSFTSNSPFNGNSDTKTVIPEPSSILLLMTGLGLILGYPVIRKRKTRKNNQSI